MNETNDIEQIIGISMPQQYSLKVCFKRFRKKGWKYAVSPELTQLHYMETFKPLYTSKSARNDVSESLESLMLLT